MSWKATTLLSLLILASQQLVAAVQLVTPDGRRVLLNDDHTWEYVTSDDSIQSPASSQPHALLKISHVNEVEGGACKLGAVLENGLPYKIKSLSIRFSAYKTESLRYESVTRGFYEIKSTDSQYQQVYFRGIGCSEIHHVKVEDPGRCSMGDLDKFSSDPGDCIALIEIEYSDQINIRK